MNSRLVIFLKSFSFLFFTIILSAFMLFYGVKLSIMDNPYHTPVHLFLPFCRFEGCTINLKFIETQPLPYLLSIAFIFSFLGALWISTFYPDYPRKFHLHLLLIPWITVILTGPVWGLIWSVNNRPPQNFADQAVMLLYYRTDALTGFQYSWLAAIQSFPINILSYATVYALLYGCKILFRN